MSFINLIQSTSDRVYNDIKQSFGTKFANCDNPPVFVGNRMSYTVTTLDGCEDSIVELAVHDDLGRLKMSFIIHEDEHCAQVLVDEITHYMCSFINIISEDIVYMYDSKTKNITCTSISMTESELGIRCKKPALMVNKA